MSDEKLLALGSDLNNSTTADGLVLSAEIINHDDSEQETLLKVEVQDRQEFPIYIHLDDEQLLCTTYLWTEDAVNADKRTEMLETMLDMNLPMPLSSFGRVGNQFLIFGAMSSQSDNSQIRHEISVLSHNTLEAVETLHEFLK